MARTRIKQAGLYRASGTDPWWSRIRMIQGKAMSFNNYLDAESAWRLVNDLRRPGVVIVKHNNPCGVAIADDITNRLPAGMGFRSPGRLWRGGRPQPPPRSRMSADAIAGRFIEVLIAPEVQTVGGLATQAALRILESPPSARPRF